MRTRQLFLTLALLCTMVQGAWAQNYDVWDGVSEQKPYCYAERDQTTGFYICIWNAAQMAYVMKHWNEEAGQNRRKGKTFPTETYLIYYEECDIYLKADLDMTAATWTAIPALKKMFDGQGHHIRIKIEGNTSNYQGLFGDIYADGRVENLHVDGNIHCDNSRLVGGIAGCNRGTISNCWVSADVRSDWDGIATLSAYVGGICGDNYYGNVEYCCMTGNVTNKRHYVAGIAGSNSYGTIKNCTFYGSLFNDPDYNTNGNKYVGWKYSEENCFDGFNQGQYDAAGGKDMYRHALMNPYTVTLITAGDGSATADYRSTYPDKTVTLNVTSGIVDKITITDADGNDVSLNGMNYGSSYSFAMPRRNVTAKVIFPGDWPTQGEGTESAPYIICCTEEWNRFAHNVSIGRDYSGKYIKLTEDISVTQKCGTVSGTTLTNAFSGTFNGDRHTITAAITDTGNQGTALFCYINGATIKNLKVAGAITGGMHAAAIVGTSEGTGNVIEGCVATANVSGGTHIGGILGHGTTSDIAISGCVFSGTMTGGGEAKGTLFGWGDNGGTKSVTDCLYVMADGQNTTNLDLVRQWDGTVSVTNCYKTTSAGSYGTQCIFTNSAPSQLGSPMKDYSLVKVYQNGIFYDGTCYMVPVSISLADNTDNSTTISNANGYVADVTLDGRTYYRDGAWNTLCLPFDATKTGLLAKAVIKELDTETAYDGHKTGFEDGTLYLNFKDAESIVAGKPYIVKWTDLSQEHIINPSGEVFAALDFITEVPTFDGGQPTNWESTQGPEKMVDGNTATKYGLSNANPWVDFHYTQAITPKGYALMTAEDTKTYGSRNPKSWTIKARNSGDASWTTLTTVDNTNNDKLPIENNQWTVFKLDNSTAYQYFRFEATKNSDFQLAELRFCTMEPGRTEYENPTFEGVTLQADAPTAVTSEDGKVSFTGTYSSMEFGETDNSILLMGGENMLYYPTTGAGLGAQHAYFKIGGNGAKARRITGFSINFGDGEATGIISAEANSSLFTIPSSLSDWYTLDGRRLSGKPTRSGIYINNGVKVVIK